MLRKRFFMMRIALRRQTRFRVFLALFVLLLSFVPPTAPVQAQTYGYEFAPGEVLIGWQPGEAPLPVVQRQNGLAPDQSDPVRQSAVAAIGSLTGLAVLDAAPEYGLARLSVRAGAEAAEIARLQELPWVRYAEPNYYAYAAADTRIPNDPDYYRQWHMEKVNAPMAWAATLGSLSFIVAVLDTGVAQNHPEFEGKLLPGKDYVNDDFSPEDDDPEGHGTHVTGIIAARFDNALGVAGLAPAVDILPMKVLNSQRTGTYGAIALAMYEAANSSAQVINLSLAGYAPSDTLRIAAADMAEQGVLVVAAAGNCAQNPGSCGGLINPDMYPAAYPDVLAVSASDRLDRGTIYSGYMPYIGLAAPGGISGEQVWSTTRAGYGYMYGTSMSTPMVSAAAALVWTLRPAATAQEVAGILKSTADKVGTDPYSGEPYSYESGRNDYFGSGRLNVGWAVRAVYPPRLATDAGPQSFLLGEPYETQSRVVELTNPSTRGVSWQATVLGASWLTVTPSVGTSLYSAPSLMTLTAELGELTPATYSGIVRIQPLDPPDLLSFDIPVELRVVESVSRFYVPFVLAAQ